MKISMLVDADQRHCWLFLYFPVTNHTKQAEAAAPEFTACAMPNG